VRDRGLVDKETETVQVVGATQSRQSADLPRALELTTERRSSIKKGTPRQWALSGQLGGGMGGGETGFCVRNNTVLRPTRRPIDKTSGLWSIRSERPLPQKKLIGYRSWHDGCCAVGSRNECPTAGFLRILLLDHGVEGSSRWSIAPSGELIPQ